MKAEWGAYHRDRQILHEILPLDTPLVVDFAATTLCNFKCNYCLHALPPEEFKKKNLGIDFISQEVFYSALEGIKEFPSKTKMVTIVGAGEPLINKELPNMIADIKRAGITDKISVVTNGSLLTKELGERLISAGLDDIKISLQGVNSESYSRISAVKLNFDEFYENIRYFSSIRGDCKLRIKVADTALLGDDEARFTELFGDICDQIGVEHIYEMNKDFGLDYSKATLPSRNTSRYGLEPRYNRVCWLPFIRMSINTDGRYSYCCMDKIRLNATVMDINPKEFWDGEMRLAFLKQMLNTAEERKGPCEHCNQPNYNYLPEDILDGHEQEILARLR